ncbi:hypothetical protein KDH83_32200, partial [Achromobacter sp. Marseille-Q0513]|uniref:hypothetical protein n=1 Tax=Achromobacter sp. Marseille-Q0513 TaxID=2829161 RepID=UPI001B9E7C2E
IISLSDYEWRLCLILALATAFALLVQPLRAFGLIGALILAVAASVLAVMVVAGYSLITGGVGQLLALFNTLTRRPEPPFGMLVGARYF